EDERFLNTTPLEGSVRVTAVKPRIFASLPPGQQARIGGGREITMNGDVDTEKVMAWKNGVFNFEGATVDEFMRQLARWYDLNIVFSGPVPDKVFHGDLGRDLKLSQILEVLALFDIRYTLQGNTLTIE